MQRVRWFVEAHRRERQGHLGEAEVLKFVALGLRPGDRCERELAGALPPVPVLDLERLRSLPEGSFRRAHARFIDDRRLTPLAVRPHQLAGVDALALRYILTHDLIHTLLGFDTTMVGEIGVFAAHVEQDTLRGGEAWLRVIAGLHIALRPWRAPAFRAAARRGRELGRTAAFLLALPFDELLARPLAAVRRQVGVLAPG